MFLFKASGKTYRKVVNHSVHAFPHKPANIRGDELILLSKNREDCKDTEKQIQNVAKLLEVRLGTEGELDRLFPGVNASTRWKYVAELYWPRRLSQPFNLSDIPGLDFAQYAQVQEFAELSLEDALAVVRHLQATNASILLEIVNYAERPGPTAS